MLASCHGPWSYLGPTDCTTGCIFPFTWTQWLLREGEGEGEGPGSLIEAALRHGPMGSGGGDTTTNPMAEGTAAAAAAAAGMVGGGRKEERPSVRSLAQRLRGCLEVRRTGKDR